MSWYHVRSHFFLRCRTTEQHVLYLQLADPANVNTFLQWYTIGTFRIVMDYFLVNAGVPNAQSNTLAQNLFALRHIGFNNLNANARDSLQALIDIMKNKANWSAGAKLVTPTNSPNNRPGPGGAPPVVGEEYKNHDVRIAGHCSEIGRAHV